MQRTFPVLAILIPILVVLGIYAPTDHFFSNQYDDAYIGYRYAINLAQGHGLVFNIGERTDAASSFLYMVVLAFFWLLDLRNLELVAATLGVASLGFITWLTYKLALRLSSDAKSSLVVGVCCGINGFLSGWTLSGMEVLPWAALILCAVYLMVIEARPWAICLVIALAAFTRFEGIFLAVPYLFLILTRGTFKKDIIPILAVGAAFSAFYIIKYSYYGVWISHAFQMKSIADYFKPMPREIIHYWMYYASIPVILSLPTLISRRYFFVFSYVALSFISVLVGPRSDYARYSVHLLPILYAFSAPLLARLGAGQRSSVAVFGVFAIVLAMSSQALAGMRFNWNNMTLIAESQICRKEVGSFINTHIGKDEYIASSDLGAISYVAIDNRFVDLMALVSSDVLSQFRAGQNADSVLVDKHIKYYADTLRITTNDRLGELLKQFPSVLQYTNFTVDMKQPLFVCTDKGGIRFVVANLVPRTFN